MITKTDLVRINNEIRESDESHLWPICGRFNATERAIRRARKAMREGLELDSADDYRTMLNELVSEIVNNSANW